MQVAEVLNNLGCLSFMCGQSGSAMTMFKECLEIQTAVLKQSLYSGPRFAGHTTSLSISVTRGNIGYVQMLTKNAGAAIVEFEASLMVRELCSLMLFFLSFSLTFPFPWSYRSTNK